MFQFSLKPIIHSVFRRRKPYSGRIAIPRRIGVSAVCQPAVFSSVTRFPPLKNGKWTSHFTCSQSSISSIPLVLSYNYYCELIEQTFASLSLLFFLILMSNCSKRRCAACTGNDITYLSYATQDDENSENSVDRP